MGKKYINDLENELKKVGVFYRSKTNALCYKLKKDTKKMIFWVKPETYREFLERCEKLN